MTNAATLTKLALAVAAKRQAQMAKRMQAAESKAQAHETLARQLSADLREANNTPATRAQAEDMVREVFAVEAMVRGVFAELKPELRGVDGKNVEPAQAEAIIRSVFAEMAPALKGRDGKNVEPQKVEALVRTVFDEMRASLKGEPGASVDLVQVNAMVQQCLKDTPPALDAQAVQALVRDEVQAIAPDLRGQDGQPGLVWRGQWVSTREYQPGEVVRYRGSSWVALVVVVGIVPGTSERHWDLLARAGSDGGSTLLQAPTDTGDAGANVKWTLANSEWPYFGYTHKKHKWKIEQITPAGVATAARPDNNGGIEYAAAWAARTTLNYAP